MSVFVPVSVHSHEARVGEKTMRPTRAVGVPRRDFAVLLAGFVVAYFLHLVGFVMPRRFDAFSQVVYESTFGFDPSTEVPRFAGPMFLAGFPKGNLLYLVHVVEVPRHPFSVFFELSTFEDVKTSCNFRVFF